MAARPTFYTPVKRNHMIAPFGVGALMLARNGVGVVVCGLDEWLKNRPSDGRNGASWLEKNQILDPHLQRRLGVNRLIRPPAVADDSPDERNTWFARVARFPLTEYCINPKCRMVITRNPEDQAPGRCQRCEGDAGPRKRAWPTQQTPLVLACEAGHLSEVPWTEWVHDPAMQPTGDDGEPLHAGGMCAKPELTYRVATDVTAPTVECETCHARVDLGSLRHRGFVCPGAKPWLPGSAADACEAKATVHERTSTSLYYAEVRSALYLPHGPELDHRLMALLAEPVAQVILGDYEPGATPDERDLRRLADIAGNRGITASPDDVACHIAASSLAADDLAEEDVRSQELEALLDGTTKTASPVGLPSLVVEPQDMSAYVWGDLADKIAAISAVPRLAETRALVGFSRVEPGHKDPAAGFEQLWGAPFDPTAERDWLLAHRVFGEGILIVLDPEAVATWEAGLQASASRLAEGVVTRLGWFPPRFVLAHTLSHLLIREAAAVCGYALPSMRERLYVTTDEHGADHTAVLIFTAEGDSYGTLGGLVELAEPGNLEQLISNAIEHARWCAADPVCIDPPQQAGLQTTPGACHHCVLLPETSCECFNTALDRAALIETDAGFTFRV
jgi:hypothetical protein